MFGFNKKKKLTVENELGNFKMLYNGKKPSYVYMGEVDWQGSEYSITAWVECDNRETFSADKGFVRLSEVLADSADWNARLKKYALGFAVENYGLDNGLIEIWGSWDPESDDEAEPVTQEEFASRISLASVTVQENGDLEFDIDLDDMFTDHCLMVHADTNGNLSDSGLAG